LPQGSTVADRVSTLGRFPANLIHDGSDEVVGLFPSDRPGGNFPEGGKKSAATDNAFGQFAGNGQPARAMGDSGSAARFFYCAKASKADRDDGCDALPFRESAEMVDRDEDSPGIQSPRAGAGRKNGARNFHPTVKPTDLMRYLCRLVTPPKGTVLDPFMGSGSTGKGAMAEGFRFIGIERDPDYFKIAEARVASGIPRQPELF
jgi:site-specific DNA-methyltransferase (adenine-specific)